MKSNLASKILLSTAFCWWASTASANLFTNGDFEGGTYQQVLGSITNNLPNGWTNAPPSALSNLNVFANGTGPGVAQSGTNYVAFQSTAPPADGQDCLNQVVPTIAGQKYEVSFWVAMTASPGAQFGLSPEWDSGGANDTTMGTNAFYYHPTDAPATPYTFFSFVETASSNSTSIYFHAADATGAVLLDNVSLTPILGTPEPSSLLLFGLGALGLAIAARRRRKA